MYKFTLECVHGIADYDINKDGIIKIDNKHIQVVEILSVVIRDQYTDVELLVKVV